MSEICEELLLEIRRLVLVPVEAKKAFPSGGVVRVVISTNIPLRKDGLPVSNWGIPDDPGAAVYFDFKQKPIVFACDKWDLVEDNLWSIVQHIEAMRGQTRWGVGSLEQQFTAYTALPPPGSSAGASWWDVLGCAHNATFDQARTAYIAAAKLHHPDAGQNLTHEAMSLVNAAWDQARKHFGK